MCNYCNSSALLSEQDVPVPCSCMNDKAVATNGSRQLIAQYCAGPSTAGPCKHLAIVATELGPH